MCSSAALLTPEPDKDHKKYFLTSLTAFLGERLTVSSVQSKAKGNKRRELQTQPVISSGLVRFNLLKICLEDIVYQRIGQRI